MRRSRSREPAAGSPSPGAPRGRDVTNCNERTEGARPRNSAEAVIARVESARLIKRPPQTRIVPRDSERPAAIVLGRELTGLATARGIADGDVEVHVFTFNGREPIHFSRRCRTTSLPGDIADAPLLEVIIERAIALG